MVRTKSIAARKALAEAIDKAGGPVMLARALGLKHQVIRRWAGRIPSRHVLTVEGLTGVPCWRLRPDLYPPKRFKSCPHCQKVLSAA